jgi:hypothetical protein
MLTLCASQMDYWMLTRHVGGVREERSRAASEEKLSRSEDRRPIN